MTEKMNVAKIFGENVFNDKVMQERLPKKVYKALRKTIDEGKELDPMVADVVAEAMKNWAVEKGATHYTHIFQPLTGVTAEKHDAFITAPRHKKYPARRDVPEQPPRQIGEAVPAYMARLHGWALETLQIVSASSHNHKDAAF